MPGSCTTFDLFLFKLHKEVSETMIMCTIDPVIVVDYIARIYLILLAKNSGYADRMFWRVAQSMGCSHHYKLSDFLWYL